MCRVYHHQASMGKSNQKIGKTHIYPSFRKSYLTSCKGIGDHKKKEKISKSKTTTLTFLYNLKRSNNIEVVKTGFTLKVLCF